MQVVISQAMYFPWVGFLEQLRLADTFVQYDDVQFSKGGFTNRVQIKTESGSRWLSVPLRDVRLGQTIDEVKLNDSKDWRHQHQDILRQAYRKAPYREDMLALVQQVLDQPATTIAEVSRASVLALVDYFGLTADLRVQDVTTLGIPGHCSDRVLDLVRAVGGDVYITGHGARNYLNHEQFENAGISVQYMEYQRVPYAQLHGEFTPYVSALDLVANQGRKGVQLIQSTAVHWKEFLHESA